MDRSRLAVELAWLLDRFPYLAAPPHVRDPRSRHLYLPLSNGGTDCTPSNKFILLNARSITNKIPDLNYLLAQGPHAVFITESWCKPNTIHDAILSYGNKYLVYRCDRDGDRIGGGVAVLIRKEIDQHLISARNFSEFCQAVAVYINLKGSEIVTVTVYRSPSTTTTAFAGLLEYLEELCLERPQKLLIVGDFNFPLIDWERLIHRGGLSSSSSSAFIDLILSHCLTQLVRKPTHGLNTLDLVITPDPAMIDDLAILPPPTSAPLITVAWHGNSRTWLLFSRTGCWFTAIQATRSYRESDALDVEARPAEVYRLSRREEGKCRLIKCVFSSRKFFFDALKNAKLLKNSEIFKNVFIRRSMTPAELEKGKQLRARANELNQSVQGGEKVYVVFRQQVVKRSDIPSILRQSPKNSKN
ncbi:endonuclease/exonuclease/phosphatase family protein [Ostertagia ostertagi]